MRNIWWPELVGMPPPILFKMDMFLCWLLVLTGNPPIVRYWEVAGQDILQIRVTSDVVFFAFVCLECPQSTAWKLKFLAHHEVVLLWSYSVIELDKYYLTRLHKCHIAKEVAHSIVTHCVCVSWAHWWALQNGSRCYGTEIPIEMLRGSLVWTRGNYVLHGMHIGATW